MQRRTRLRPVGRVKDRWLPHQRKARDIVIVRARGWCEAPECREPGTDWAHAFGRRHIVGEPLCSLPSMTFWLCHPHHVQMDEKDPEFQAEMRWTAIDRTCDALRAEPWVSEWPPGEIFTPEGAARHIEANWTPPKDLTPFYRV
ncbi:MAG: hypothetical protein KGR26_00355 [Cyanobacteria bacterium REEB65]|nr:hypothetical protein [Cyanobacteria bacterium REEB65]